MAESNGTSGIKSPEKLLSFPLVSLPNIVLTRIDEVSTPFKNAFLPKTSLKKVSVKKKTKSTMNSEKKLPPNEAVKRPRGRPKSLRLGFSTTSLKKTGQKMSKGIDTSTKQKSVIRPIVKRNKRVPTPKKPLPKLQNSSTKSMLKKTMLQNKSKISISQAKTPKPIKSKLIKPLPIKVNKPKAPVSLVQPPPPTKEESDSSEDEFLYDELINELENTFYKSNIMPLKSDKKTITVKPSIGDKPPTIVKGGIIKVNQLPFDLKTIMSQGQDQFTQSKIKEAPNLKRCKLSQDNHPVPSKKPSPWPVSISNSPKKSVNITQNKIKYDRSKNTTPEYPFCETSKNKLKENGPNNNAGINRDHRFVKSQMNSPVVIKPKMGPKQTAKVSPISQMCNDDDSMSDEYTEEETLEEYKEDVALLKKASKQNKLRQNIDYLTETSTNPTLHLKESKSVNDDSNIDLLRILTDDNDAPEQADLITKPDKIELGSNQSGTEQGLKDNSVHGHNVRTIYDLINEVSLQRPSWNLHIMPETNAFCIAQVTKGRLGLPTLKKCIELDPENYSAKVYIHQYHIKRFDGIYDSEDRILALLEEIDSIKA